MIDLSASHVIEHSFSESHVIIPKTIHVTENPRLSKLGNDARKRAKEDVMQEMVVQIIHLADLNLQDRHQPSSEE